MRIIFITFTSLILSLGLIAQTNPTFTNYASGFDNPVDIVSANDGTDRLFIVEQDGTIKIINSAGTVQAGNFLNISGSVSNGNEQGLLGMAFHPNYAANGFFYINYTANNGDTHIARFQVNGANPNQANAASESTLMIIDQPFSNHNAGDLNFGPDGYLYIALGDGGSGGDPDCYAQNTSTTGIYANNRDFLGKMLRLDVNQNMNTAPFYGIPPSNPFVANAAISDEIYALGLRNPWRFSFDRQTGDLWIADVGQGSREEVDFVPAAGTAGRNYGWKMMEGNTCFGTGNCAAGIPACNAASLTDPIFEYNHGAQGGQSITGGYVYRGAAAPALQGFYICVDYVSNNVWTVRSDGCSSFYGSLPGSANISTFGEDENGELYAAGHGNGIIYRVGGGTDNSCGNCLADPTYAGNVATGTYSSSNSITSTGTVSTGSSVNFYSNCILLDAGFNVEDNAIFCAEIIPCTPFVSQDDLSK